MSKLLEVFNHKIAAPNKQITHTMSIMYLHMFLALATSALISWLVGNNPGLVAVLFTGITKWVVMLLPLAMILVITPLIDRTESESVLFILLQSFAIAIGLSISSIFVAYSLPAIVSSFVGASILFIIMSGYGLVTNRDLSSIGQYAFIALISIIAVSLFNLLIGNSILTMIISAISILVFMALTAADTQQIRDTLSVDPSNSNIARSSLLLYLNVINIFLNLLTLSGLDD